MTDQTREIMTEERLAGDLRALGVHPGDTLYPHTSIKAIGWMEEGAHTLIRALQAAVGSEGTIAAPTHTLCFTGLTDQPYRAWETPSLLGAFSDTLWRMPGAVRSGHGSHSSAALGKRAAWLTQGHDPYNALGEQSPVHRVYALGGKVLLIGVTHRADTMLHLAERLAGLPYVKLHYDETWGYDVAVACPDGRVERFTQAEIPGCSNGFDRIGPLLEQAGLVRRGYIGAAPSQLIDAASMVDFAVDLLRRDPTFLLCASEQCPCCPKRRQM